MSNDKRWQTALLALILLSSLGILVTACTGFVSDTAANSVLIACGLGCLVGCVALWFRMTGAGSVTSTGPESEQRQIDELREATLRMFNDRAAHLAERERELTARLVKFREFLEYPAEDPNQNRTPVELQQLTEQDRKVQELLEAEAARVYEAIRTNRYSRDGVVDLRLIRDEVEDLIVRIARIYKPGSERPLLETSFEQLARAASRVCLHTLVLLEQLPVSVHAYNISDLYRYLQHATTAWDTFQKASPWLKHVSRGLYAGRLASTTNPVALGAWWLATEIGRRGASKALETWVDRQAIAVLHDMVAVVGVEVASIYGNGFRQRDAAWVEGCELVELLHMFPPSRESLQEALNQITRLPLRNEYDRIYLYRCLATQRSSGFRLTDSSLLSRSQRESIARVVEEFFGRFVHGVSDARLREWRDGLEERLDLKLQLHAGSTPSASPVELASRANGSLYGFLRHVLDLDHDSAIAALKNCGWESISVSGASETLNLPEPGESSPGIFQPPDLDPADEITARYLRSLARLAAQLVPAEDHIVALVVQTGAWFRRSTQEMTDLLHEEWLHQLRSIADEDAVHRELYGAAARATLILRDTSEVLKYSYPGVARLINGEPMPLEGAWLIGFRDPATQAVRAVLWRLTNTEPLVLWTHHGDLIVQRRRGILLDDAEIVGGEWTVAVPPTSRGHVVVGGSLRGGRFSSYFRPLLANAP